MNAFLRLRDRLRSIRGELRGKRQSDAGTVARIQGVWEMIYLPPWRLQARFMRRNIGTYIAVLGSVGKSTATLLAGRLLQAQRPTGLGIFQNDQRHALRFVRKSTKPVEYFVQELSEHPPGTIAATAKVLRPDGALITAIGLDHKTAFASHAAVVAQMVPLVRELPAGGFLCLNADDPSVMSVQPHHAGKCVTFGSVETADLRYSNVNSSLEERLSFDLTVDGVVRHVQTRFVGTLLLPSIVGSLAVIHATGCDVERAIADLATIEPIANRMAALEGDDGHVYIVDTYKATHWSTERMIDDLPNLGGGRRILVLGEVSDMVNESGRKYRKMMRRATQHCDLVVGTSRAASSAERLALNEPQLRVVSAPSPADVRAIIGKQPPSLVIIKGNAMNKWVQEYSGALFERARASAPPARQ